MFCCSYCLVALKLSPGLRDGQVVRASHLKTNGIFPRGFE